MIRRYPKKTDRRTSNHCKHHGACPWCRDNRTIQTTKERDRASVPDTN